MGDEKRYYWLKLKDDFFQSRKMKKLRKVAGGDTYTIIYLKLQLLSINNDGVIEFEGTDEDIFHQLALEIDEEIDDIKMTVAFCTANDLIEIKEQDLFLNDVPHLIGSETQAARRMRRKRARDNKAIESSTNGNNVLNERNNVTEERNNVRSCYTEIDIDKDIENRDIYSRAEHDRVADKIPYKEIVSYLNNKTGKNYKPTSKKTQSLIKSRYNEGFKLSDFKRVIDNKVVDWANNDQMNKYLRPETLFSSKFEGYLNEVAKSDASNSNDYAQKAREERFKRMLEFGND
ncbi:conserved phage C-terminal domain-containing protein [Anaerococcus sp. Marseille-Q5996]|uniref:conserved phage C-terminal domain-containing protein n=1 Tax=Anaerococcus sp. Marseille-Q5996 TaxID=2972769 RepID=UPI0021C94707|nr:conserved phage C-terminal domain-containing protein [Anaerococcus sp. Marseille-Q5996]